MESLEEMLEATMVKDDSTAVQADVQVEIKKEPEQLQLDLEFDDEKKEEPKKEVNTEELKKSAMDKLGEFEALENKKTIISGDLTKAQQELEMLFSKVRAQNIDLINKINDLTNELEVIGDNQDKIKEELLPMQKELFDANEKDKTLVYNKIQSTFVAATEKNQFDLKSFREEQKDFWEKNYSLLKDYAKITNVSEYLKITIKK